MFLPISTEPRWMSPGRGGAGPGHPPPARPPGLVRPELMRPAVNKAASIFQLSGAGQRSPSNSGGQESQILVSVVPNTPTSTTPTTGQSPSTLYYVIPQVTSYKFVPISLSLT